MHDYARGDTVKIRDNYWENPAFRGRIGIVRKRKDGQSYEVVLIYNRSAHPQKLILKIQDRFLEPVPYPTGKGVRVCWRKRLWRVVDGGRQD